MKRRAITADPPQAALEPSLAEALLALRNSEELVAFLHDLCTPAELEALADRWRVVPWLLRGVPYREIHEHTAVSVTTIGRVARSLAEGAGGYRRAAQRLAIGADHDAPPPPPEPRAPRATKTGKTR